MYHKVSFLGCKRSGKTSLALRMVHDVFNASSDSTTSAGYLGNSLRAKGQGQVLRLWDTVGQGSGDTLDEIVNRSVCDAQVLLTVYDVTDIESFAAVETMVRHVLAKRQDMPIIVVGNKADGLGRMVLEVDGQGLAAKLGAFFVETSAKTGGGLTHLEELILDILEDPDFDPPCQCWLPDLVLTVTAFSADSGHVSVVCTSISGSVAAKLHLDRPVTLDCLRQMLAQKVGLPRTRLKLVLPSGELLERTAALCSLLDC